MKFDAQDKKELFCRISGKLRGILLSLPTRERGLKLIELAEDDYLIASLPTRERGLK